MSLTNLGISFQKVWLLTQGVFCGIVRISLSGNSLIMRAEGGNWWTAYATYINAYIATTEIYSDHI